MDFGQVKTFFICWKSNYGCPGASPSRSPPFSVIFCFYPKCQYELFKLFVTELKFLDRN